MEDHELRPEYRRARPRRKLPALPRVMSSLSNQLTPPLSRKNREENRSASENGHNRRLLPSLNIAR